MFKGSSCEGANLDDGYIHVPFGDIAFPHTTFPFMGVSPRTLKVSTPAHTKHLGW